MAEPHPRRGGACDLVQTFDVLFRPVFALVTIGGDGLAELLAQQTADQWADAFSTRMLERSAEFAAAICRRWDTPVRSIDAEGLLAGERGSTTHDRVPLGPGRGPTDHTEPGSHFATARHLELVAEALAGAGSRALRASPASLRSRGFSGRGRV